MKNAIKAFGIIALVAIIGLSFTALSLTGCDTGDDEELLEFSGTFTYTSGEIKGGVAKVGATSTVNYEGDGSKNVSYQWCKDGVAIPGAVAKSFTFEEPGFYEVIISAPGYKSRTYTIATVTNEGPIPTAISWSPLQDNITRGGFRSVVWGNNKFVAAGQSGKIIYSSDGINWSAVTNSTFDTAPSGCIEKVIYTGDKFIAIGDRSSTTTERNWIEIAASTDGVTWTKITPVFNPPLVVHTEIMDIAYGNGTFVIATNNYQAPLFYSADAINWNKVTNTLFGSTSISLPYSILWGNGTFVAAGRYGDNGLIEVSSDNINWTGKYVPNSTANTFMSVTYCSGKFVVGGTKNEIYYSADNGETWQTITQAIPILSNDEKISVVRSGDHQFLKFIAIAGSVIIYSQDGINWTGGAWGNAPLIGLINDVAWGNGKYVIVGSGYMFNNQSIAYSTN